MDAERQPACQSAATSLAAAFAVVLALLVAGATPAFAAPSELIVRFEPAANAAERADARRDAGVTFERALPVPGMQLVALGPGRSLRDAESRLDRDGDVAYAEPNLVRAVSRIPNDTYFVREWGLNNTGQSVLGVAGTPDADIDAPEAWEVTTGSAGVPVAVIDSGVSLHPDLIPNQWANPGESGAGRESNGVDDDGDGLVDDVRGWDWVDGDGAPDDANGHGTHVAGTIAARGDDGTGVAGVTWSSGVMALRVLDADGDGSLADVISAYGYAAAHGAMVVNASFGGAGFSQAEYDALRTAPGTLFVAAAGNDGLDNDALAQYPCAYSLPNVLCVAATDQRDALASFSNYGDTTVDLGAPGTRILSDEPSGAYLYMSGTSMATPHVSGVAALVLTHAPSASVAAVRQAILAGADPDPALAGRTVTGRRLNAFGALLGIDGKLPLSSPADAAPPPADAAPPAVPVPPRVSLAVPRRKSVRWVIRHGLRVRVGCSVACTLTVKALRSRSRRAAALAGRRSVSVVAGTTKAVTVRLSRSAKRALRRGRRARITVVVTPTGFNVAAVSKSLRLARR